jgi:hypothetical protein
MTNGEGAKSSVIQKCPHPAVGGYGKALALCANDQSLFTSHQSHSPTRSGVRAPPYASSGRIGCDSKRLQGN